VIKNNYTPKPYTHKIHSAMFGVDSNLLDDGKRLEQILVEACTIGKYKIVDKSICQHEPQGVSASVAIEESYLIIQTWPENNCLILDISSCAGPPLDAYDYILKKCSPNKFNFSEAVISVKKDLAQNLLEFNEEVLKNRTYLK